MQFAALPTSPSPTRSRRGPSLSRLKGRRGVFPARFILGQPLGPFAGDGEPAPERPQRCFEVV